MKIELPLWSAGFSLKREREFEPGQGYFYFLGERPEKKYKSIIEEHALAYQKESLLKSDRETVHFVGSKGLVWIGRRSKKKNASQGGVFQESLYASARDNSGALVSVLKALQVRRLDMEFWGQPNQKKLVPSLVLSWEHINFVQLMRGRTILNSYPRLVFKVRVKALTQNVFSKLRD